MRFGLGGLHLTIALSLESTVTIFQFKKEKLRKKRY